MKKIFLFLISIYGCITLSPDVMRYKDTNIYTLRLFTGSRAEKLYDEEFWKKGEALCPEGFELKETTRTPYTLPKNMHSDYYYTWIIECKEYSK